MASHSPLGSVYPGGKGKCFQHIINVMPPHDRYIESHLGSGAVLRHKRPARENIGIEIDPRVLARWHHSSISNLQIISGDAREILPKLSLRRDDLVYCDPPYLPELRKREIAYRFDYRAEDHISLLETLRSLDCQIVLSGYSSELYDRELHGWHKLQFQAQTQAGPVIEAVWTNFIPGPVLHDYSYIGSSFRDRERLRRRVTTLAEKLSKAPPIERNAALATLADIAPEALLVAARRLR